MPWPSPTWLRCFAIVLLCFLGAPHLRAQCPAPQYRVGQVNKSRAPAVSVDIAIKQEDLAPEKLICLTNVLKQAFQDPEVFVQIFDSYKAALNYRPIVEYTRDEAFWQSRQHAFYYYNRDKHEEYLLLIPDGLRGAHSSFDTRIDLPVNGRPPCRLEVHNRCLLMFGHIDVATGSDPAKVTLTAQIEKSGRLTDVRVVDPGGTTSAQQHAFADFAVQNLKSWRFERSQTKETIRITYSLERIATPLEGGIKVEFNLPDKVNIQTGPQLISR